MFEVNIKDLSKREFNLLIPLVILVVLLGINTSPILDGLNYSVSTLICNTDFTSLGLFPLLPLSLWSKNALNCASNPPKPHAFTSLPLVGFRRRSDTKDLD